MQTILRRLPAAALALWLGPAPAAAQVAAPLPRALPPSAAAPGPAPAETAIVSYEGFIEVEAGNGRRERVGAVPFTVFTGNKVHTYRKGKATILFRDGSQIVLGPYAIFTVQEQSAQNITLHLGAGKLWAIVSKLQQRQFSVRTPVAVASVRGTEFSVEAVSAKTSAIEVFGGMVAVRGALGDEALLTANQRVDVLEGRLGRLERFEGTMEQRQRQEQGKKEDKKERRGERAERHEHMKAALEREVGFQMGREAIESAAAFEMKNALYQEGKTLIDAFGHRVRVEEYITRPTPSSFKFVSLNFRDGRLDKGLFEVTANRALPSDLGSIDLWFSPTDTKPEFYAVRQRFVLSNSLGDSVTQMAVDGDSQKFTFTSEPVFDPEKGTFLAPAVRTVHGTVFGNVYEFINESPVALNDIWSGASRPNDTAGMMWHMQPINVVVKDATGCPGACNNTVKGSYWDYAFLTFDGANGSTGKMFIDQSFAPNPGLAHFVENRNYINFVDDNGNGILDFGEPTIGAADPKNPFGVAVYHDKVARLDGTNLINYGVGQKDAQNTAGDSNFFSDKNNDNLNNQVGAAFQYAATGPTDQGLFDFAHGNPREWARAETFIINDLGEIFDFRNLFGAIGNSDSAAAQNQIVDIFSRLNFERAVTSSKFPGRSIDVVMTPRILLKSGLVDTKVKHEAVDAPSNN